MSASVFFAVLFAALLHAGWNAWVKGGRDGFTAILLLALGQSLIAAIALIAVGLPPASALPWVAASALLHCGYKAFLISAYEQGDLSQIYPIARGTAPLIVAVGGLLFLGEALAPAAPDGLEGKPAPGELRPAEHEDPIERNRGEDEGGGVARETRA